jgi:hypothetical protein
VWLVLNERAIIRGIYIYIYIYCHYTNKAHNFWYYTQLLFLAGKVKQQTKTSYSCYGVMWDDVIAMGLQNWRKKNLPAYVCAHISFWCNHLSSLEEQK